MKFFITAMALLSASSSFALPQATAPIYSYGKAKVNINKATTYIENDRVKFKFETICSKEFLIPVYDLRKQQTHGGLSEIGNFKCNTIVNGTNVEVEIGAEAYLASGHLNQSDPIADMFNLTTYILLNYDETSGIKLAKPPAGYAGSRDLNPQSIFTATPGINDDITPEGKIEHYDTAIFSNLEYSGQ